MKKKVLITTDIILLLATVVPVVLLFISCLSSAINGVIPEGGNYPPDMSEKIYGLPAFINTLGAELVWLFPLVVLWGCLLLGTIFFTLFTMIYVNTKAAKPE